MGYLSPLILILALTVSTLADGCEAVPVYGRVVREVRPHVYRPLRGARVVIIKGQQTWIAVTDTLGRYSTMVSSCGDYDATAVARGTLFDFQTFRLADDADSINVDIVSIPRWRQKQKK